MAKLAVVLVLWHLSRTAAGVAAACAGQESQHCPAISGAEANVEDEGDEASLLSTFTQDRAQRASSILRRIRIENRCNRTVYFLEANKQGIAPSRSATFDSSSGVTLDHRLTLLFQQHANVVTESSSVLELNGAFRGPLGSPSNWANLNFVNQVSFFLPMEVALWQDEARTQLVCEDARARCTYSVDDCKFMDGQASVQSSTKWNPNGDEAPYNVCEASNPGSNAQGCVNGYARYLTEQCAKFNPASGQWVPGTYSVGYSNHGWTQARYTDGQVRTSTHTGRADCNSESCTAVTYECFEAPCNYGNDQQKAQCIADGHVPVGNAGFAISCGSLDVVDVAVMEVVACPTGPAGPSPAPGPAPPPAPTTTVAPELGSADCKSPLHPGCNLLVGNCCPAADGQMLACCDAARPQTPAPTRSPAPAPSPAPTPACEELSSQCLKDLRWAMTTGIYKFPEWYPGLTPQSPQADFQRRVHTALGTCPLPCGEGPAP